MKWILKLFMHILNYFIILLTETNSTVALTNEVFLQASIFHELCDNTEGLINSAYSIQPDQVLMLKCLHDPYLCLNIRADNCEKGAK